MSRDIDAELVKKVQAGDKKAFDVLVIKYQSKIFAIISRFISDHAEVNDVAQDAFIKAYKALPNFRGDSAFYTWIYRIAINTAKNYLTARGRRPPNSDIDSQEAETYAIGGSLQEHSSPESLLMRDQLKKVIFDTIDSLPDDLKTAIAALFAEAINLLVMSPCVFFIPGRNAFISLSKYPENRSPLSLASS